MNIKYQQKIKKKQQLCKQTLVDKNWKKVRNIVQKLKHKQSSQKLFLKQKRCQFQSQILNQSSLITKYQTMLTHEQMEKFIKNNQYFTLNFKSTEGIIKTTNILNASKIEPQDKLQDKTKKCNNIPIQTNNSLNLVTYRPIPKLTYLINQNQQKGNIDTTGTWVWQAQEILSYFILKSYVNLINNSYIKILQIGAGCSGLASLVLTKILSTQHLYFKTLSNQQMMVIQHIYQQQQQQPIIQTIISDGKQQNVVYLQKNIQQNFSNILNNSNIKITGCHYIWGTQLQTNNKIIYQFDIILGADILFFQEYHHQLMLTFGYYLAENGVALLVNPKRGCSMDKFVNKLNKYSYQSEGNCYKLVIKIIPFQDQKYECYMKQKQKRQNYDSNTDDFIFMEIRKIKQTSPIVDISL